MYALIASLPILLSAACCLGAETNRVAMCAADLAAALEAGEDGVRFDFEATVAFPCNPMCNAYSVEDHTGAAVLRDVAFWPKCPMRAGDCVRVRGSTAVKTLSRILLATSEKVEIRSGGTPPKCVDATAEDILGGRVDNRVVRLEGVVRDAFRDEIDARWIYVVIQCGRESVYACFPVPETERVSLGELVSAKVEATGLCSANNPGVRQFMGRLVMLEGRDSLRILIPAPVDPFDAPPLTATPGVHAAIVNGMVRRRAAGRVIAVWHGDRFLLRADDCRIVRVDLSDGPTPEYGMSVEAAGQPETDLFRLNLSCAKWRACNEAFQTEPPPVRITAAQMLTDEKGRPAVRARLHGQAIRIEGLVLDVLDGEGDSARIELECDRRVVTAHVGACREALDGVEAGCRLDVSGICLVESENWRPNAPFPHVDGFSVVARTPGDIRIVSRPPSLTPSRLLAVIGALLALLAAVSTWNRSLNRLAERRGRKLAEEKLARAAADMKVKERTRMAIELHDSLSQSLTGAALEVETSDALVEEGDAAEVRRHLGIAASTLKSCREELRNCLWDLRNDTLGELTMDAAIRRTLEPHFDSVHLYVRFDVQRERLSDDTAHTVLRIIRELALNAVHHGHAESVMVEGSLDGNTLLFSVQDDGCGFDVDAVPGVRQGHFGLQGVRERVRHLDGEMRISSTPVDGTKITVSVKLSPQSHSPQGKDK